MLTTEADIGCRLFASVVGGHWERDYASSRADGRNLFVFRRVDGDREVLVLRNDDVCLGATRLSIPGIGQMYCHGYRNDPAFNGLQQLLDTYESCDVLRYRPGKRITLAAVDQVQGPIIIKCVAAGIDEIFQLQSNLWDSRTALDFSVSQPLLCLSEWNTFVQRRLPGTPLRFDQLAADMTIASRMAVAVRSLHRSDVGLDNYFGVNEQRSRSIRYAALIQSRLPGIATEVDDLVRCLLNLEDSLDNDLQQMVPIHGSLHSHQWLLQGENLALIDFDRSSMGHAELDIATFLTEIEYEPLDYTQKLSRNFLDVFDDVDPQKLAWYCAHKHLAKAYKKSRTANKRVAMSKTRRSLACAMTVLTNIKEY